MKNAKSNSISSVSNPVVTVTALLGDSPLCVRRLAGPPSPLRRAIAWGLVGLGLAGALAGLVCAVAGQAGLAGLLLVGGLGQAVYGWTRLRETLRSPHFMVGQGRGADMAVPGVRLPGETLPLVRHTGAGHELLFCNEMRGTVTLGEVGMELSGLFSSGRAAPEPGLPGWFSTPIEPEAEYRLSVGEVGFTIHGSTASGAMQGGLLSRVDWEDQVYNGASFAAHGLVLFLVLAMPPSGHTLGLGNLERESRMVRFEHRPVEEKVPEWLQKSNQEPEQAAAEVKKTDGRPTRRLTRRSGGNNAPAPVSAEAAQHLAQQAARGMGALAVLNGPGGAFMKSIFSADSALGREAMDAMDGLQGDASGETLGIGGLGLNGIGRGWGPGDGIGYGPLGTISGKPGSGGPGGGSPYGGFALPKRPKKDTDIVKATGDARLRGSLSKEIVRRVIRRHLNEVRYCYQKELQQNGDLFGRLVVNFTIAPNGTVVASGVKDSTLGHAGVESCIAQAVRRWLFPKPEDGGLVVVSYPFVLRSAGN